MTKREIASLAIKLMGVFILLKMIAYIPMTLSGLFYQGKSSEFPDFLFMLFLMLFIFGVSLVWALFIIARSDLITAWLLKNDKTVANAEIGVCSSIDKKDVMIITCSCIGLYLIVTSVPNLVIYISEIFAMRRAGGDYVTYTSGGLYKFSRIIAPTIQIGLGIWLFAGSRGIVKLWKKIRS